MVLGAISVEKVVSVGWIGDPVIDSSLVGSVNMTELNATDGLTDTEARSM